MKISIVGRLSQVENYTRLVTACGATPLVTLNLGEAAACDALLLPGGGDIDPVFFGQKNKGSHKADTELDLIQLQAFSVFLTMQKPILGICKGMQVINVGLGGTILQDLPSSWMHKYDGGDQYHTTVIQKNTWLNALYGSEAFINSAHHQALDTVAAGLTVVQYCPLDACPEGIAHKHLPIFGVQWHPERLDSSRTMVSGEKVMSFLVSLIPSSQ